MNPISSHTEDLNKALVPITNVPGWDPKNITQTIDKIWQFFPKSSVDTPPALSAFFLTHLSHIAVHIAMTATLQHLADLSIHYFSRPKLAIEARYTNWYDQLVNAKSTNIVQLFLTTIGVGSATSWYAEHRINEKQGKNGYQTALKFLSCVVSTTCGPRSTESENGGIKDSWYKFWKCLDQPLSPGFIKTTSRVWGLFYGLYTGYPLLLKLEFPKATPEEKPIFNPKLTATLNTLVETTSKLSKKKAVLQNLLLYGPPGTGKTMMAKFIARNSKMNYVMISGGTLSQYIKTGEHVTELNNLFIKAKNSYAPTIIFVDEAESLCRHRSYLSEEIERTELLNAFLNRTGENNKHVMLILATNRLEDLDPAVLNRMDYKLQVLPPDLKERKEILRTNIARMFTKEETLLFDLESLAKNTKALSGRTLVKMLNAILSNKTVSTSRKLSKEIINETSEQFIEQEKPFQEAEPLAMPNMQKLQKKIPLLKNLATAFWAKKENPPKPLKKAPILKARLPTSPPATNQESRKRAELIKELASKNFLK